MEADFSASRESIKRTVNDSDSSHDGGKKRTRAPSSECADTTAHAEPSVYENLISVASLPQDETTLIRGMLLCDAEDIAGRRFN